MCVPSVNSEAGNRLLVIAGASLSLYRLSVSRRYNSEDLPAITNDFLFHFLVSCERKEEREGRRNREQRKRSLKEKEKGEGSVATHKTKRKPLIRS